MKIIEIREVTAPIASSIANAYIDFSKMTLMEVWKNVSPTAPVGRVDYWDTV